MSRIGRMPITIPAGVTVTVKDGNAVSVKGPKGELNQKFDKIVKIEEKDNVLTFTIPDDNIHSRMNHGTVRAVVAGMIEGVQNGFSKTLVIKGVGYRAEMQGKDLVLHVGHTHPDIIKGMDGISMAINTKDMSITVSGFDKQLVGQVAANIRSKKKPECYHGKGIRYQDEVVVLRQPASAKKSAVGAAAPAAGAAK
ncbi:MAG: 50S ribosomal protein L6 [Bacilli bacterium]|nr:50S ribosomal protein L6 [Bacilli bacterium]